MKIYLDYQNYRDVNNPTEKYGEWSASNDFTENNFSLEDIHSGISFDIDFEVSLGDVVHLVKGEYSTGDSFGKETGCIEYIEVFNDVKEAFDFKKKVEYINKINKNSWYGYKPKEKAYEIKELEKKLEGSFTIRESWGKQYILKYKNKEYNFPWGGYFENLQNVRVISLEVK